MTVSPSRRAQPPSIAVQLHEIREAQPDVVQREGALGISCDLHPLKRRQVLIDLGPQVVELPFERRDLSIHTELLVASQLLQLINLLFEVEDGSLELHSWRRSQFSSRVRD